MNEAAADCATVARLHMANPMQGGTNERHGLTKGRTLLERALPRGGAGNDRARAGGDPPQSVEAINVHQNGRASEAHGHHRHQALSACDELGVWPMLVEHFQSVF
jgi:hypothetical protein